MDSDFLKENTHAHVPSVCQGGGFQQPARKAPHRTKRAVLRKITAFQEEKKLVMGHHFTPESLITMTEIQKLKMESKLMTVVADL